MIFFKNNKTIISIKEDYKIKIFKNTEQRRLNTYKRVKYVLAEIKKENQNTIREINFLMKEQREK